MKNLILALIVLLTSTITSQISKFNYIAWDIVSDNDPKPCKAPQYKSGKVYHTYKPDSVIKDPAFYGQECIIFVYNDRKDDVDFFPITHKEYTDSSIIYSCYNGAVELKIIYNETENNYMMSWYSIRNAAFAEALYTE